MSGNSARGRRGGGVVLACLAGAAVCALAGSALRAEGPALKLRATAIGASASVAPFTIDLFRWSTDAERAPLVAALSAPRPAAPAAAAPAGRAAGGRAAGRGGRGAPPPPQSPAARLTSATKAAPTVGFLWGDGATGYSIKYAWHAASPDGQERVVLLTDRRIGANAASSSPAQAASAAPDVEFTVIELRLDAKGGEGKMSTTGAVVVDTAASTLALDGYAAAPALLKVTR